MYFLEVVFGQIQACHNTDPLQWAIIIALTGGILVGSGIGDTGIAYVAGTLITMLIPLMAKTQEPLLFPETQWGYLLATDHYFVCLT